MAAPKFRYFCIEQVLIAVCRILVPDGETSELPFGDPPPAASAASSAFRVRSRERAVRG